MAAHVQSDRHTEPVLRGFGDVRGITDEEEEDKFLQTRKQKISELSDAVRKV